jgi:hypothetical protein
MRVPILLLGAALMPACSGLQVAAPPDHCHLGRKHSWHVLNAPPANAAELLAIADENPATHGVKGPDLWLSHSNGNILLCRGNSDAGEKWTFRQRDGHWEAESEVEVWVVAK